MKWAVFTKSRLGTTVMAYPTEEAATKMAVWAIDHARVEFAFVCQVGAL